MQTSTSVENLRFFEVYPQKNLNIKTIIIPRKFDLKPQNRKPHPHLKSFSHPSSSKKPQNIFEVFLRILKNPQKEIGLIYKTI